MRFNRSNIRFLSSRNYPNKESYPENSGHFHRGTPRKGECICGEDLTEDHREHLLSLQQEMSTVVETNLEGKMAIPGMLQDAEEHAETLIEKRQKLAKLEEKERQKNKELNEISEQLKAHDIPEGVDVQELENSEPNTKTSWRTSRNVKESSKFVLSRRKRSEMTKEGVQ